MFYNSLIALKYKIKITLWNRYINLSQRQTKLKSDSHTKMTRSWGNFM